MSPRAPPNSLQSHSTAWTWLESMSRCWPDAGMLQNGASDFASSWAIRRNDLHLLHCIDDGNDPADSCTPVYASSQLNLADCGGESQSEHNQLASSVACMKKLLVVEIRPPVQAYDGAGLSWRAALHQTGEQWLCVIIVIRLSLPLCTIKPALASQHQPHR